MALGELGQMGRNFVSNPTGFIGQHGLGATCDAAGKAIDNAGRAIGNAGKSIRKHLPSMPSLPTMVPGNERKLPGEDFENGDTWGSRTRDSFTPSKSVKTPKQHASNLVPGERNDYGGRFDFSA